MYIHVFECLPDSLNRVIKLCYIDVVDPWLILVVCLGSNYSIWGYDWRLQVGWKVKLMTDSK